MPLSLVLATDKIRTFSKHFHFESFLAKSFHSCRKVKWLNFTFLRNNHEQYFSVTTKSTADETCIALSKWRKVGLSIELQVAESKNPTSTMFSHSLQKFNARYLGKFRINMIENDVKEIVSRAEKMNGASERKNIRCCCVRTISFQTKHKHPRSSRSSRHLYSGNSEHLIDQRKVAATSVNEAVQYFSVLDLVIQQSKNKSDERQLTGWQSYN